MNQHLLRFLPLALLWTLSSSSAAQTCTLSRVSLDPLGNETTGHSGAVVLSRDGRFVAFASSASNLVPGDTNNSDDIFVHDRVLQTTELITVDSNGIQADIQSNGPSISADGRFVLYSSWAHNLVPGDMNNTNDVFLRDRTLGTTVRISTGPSGVEGNGGSYFGVISRNGRFVTFLSSASNLVPNDTNDARDVFLFDRQTGVMELVSVSSTGVQGDNWAGGSAGGPQVSDDGRFVVFQSPATNLVPNDTNGVTDVFVRDRVLGTTARVSLGLGGVEANGASDVTSITPDGRYIGIVSLASNLVANDTNDTHDTFVLDRVTGVFERVSVTSGGQQATGSNWAPTLSDDGRFVTFTSTSSDLVPGDTNEKRDVFLRDRAAGTTEIVSSSTLGAPADNDCFYGVISGDSHMIAFTSASSMLVFGDLNGLYDVFVLECRPADLFCFGTPSTCPCANSTDPGAGCATASTSGARFDAVGSAHILSDSLTLLATGLPLGTTVAFLTGPGPSTPASGIQFGDGLFCLSTPVTRIAVRAAPDGTAGFGFLAGDPLLSVLGAVPLGGDYRHYQAWYRSIENFCTSATFNFSNGATVLWLP
ncbi:MAG: hypothetical protein JNL28_02285 [Planctomycetes bacterium]|nr:hypothetical protein [Planctomycetota bacterium]